MGELNIYKGMINKLSKEFALKSERERKEIFADLLLFLHDHRVPATNNVAERLLGGYKRKQYQHKKK